MQGIANIAAIDASNEKVDVNIQGYPTIKLFVDGKASDYNGERNAAGIIDFMLKEFKKVNLILFRLQIKESELNQTVAVHKVARLMVIQMRKTWSY